MSEMQIRVLEGLMTAWFVPRDQVIRTIASCRSLLHECHPTSVCTIEPYHFHGAWRLRADQRDHLVYVVAPSPHQPWIVLITPYDDNKHAWEAQQYYEFLSRADAMLPYDKPSKDEAIYALTNYDIVAPSDSGMAIFQQAYCDGKPCVCGQYRGAY